MDSDTSIPPGATSVPIPYTLEPNRVLGVQRYRSRLWFAGVVVGLYLIFSIGFLFSGVGILSKLFLIFLAGTAVLYGVRFLVLEERIYRKNQKRHDRNDYKFSTASLWGIYHIDNDYPYIIRYRNGRLAIAALFESNVKVGRDTVSHHHHHYESVAEAYRVMGAMGLQVTHVDQMIDVGVDPRIDRLFDSLNDVENPDVRDLLTSIYDGLSSDVATFVSSQDIFILSGKVSSSDIISGFEQFKEHMVGTGANFVGFRILDKESLRSLAQELFNLQEFSAVEAATTSTSQNRRDIKPIKLIHPDGSETSLLSKEVSS